MDINLVTMMAAASEYKKYQQLLKDEQYIRIEIKKSIGKKLELKREVEILSDNIKTLKKRRLVDDEKIDDLKELLKEKHSHVKEENLALTQKYEDLEDAKRARKNKWADLLRDESFLYLAGTESISKYLLPI